MEGGKVRLGDKTFNDRRQKGKTISRKRLIRKEWVRKSRKADEERKW